MHRRRLAILRTDARGAQASEVRVQAEHHPRLPPESVHTRYFGPAHVRPALADGEASSGAGAAGRAGAGANASAGLSTSSGGQSAGEEIVEAAKALGEKFVGEVAGVKARGPACSHPPSIHELMLA